MNRIILHIEIGDWEGGNNGRYPKLIKFNPSDENSPFMESEGWGWGLSGCSYSLKGFVSSGALKKLDTPDASWAYEIINHSLDNQLSIKQIADLLMAGYQQNKPRIPQELEVYLNNA